MAEESQSKYTGIKPINDGKIKRQDNNIMSSDTIGLEALERIYNDHNLETGRRSASEKIAQFVGKILGN